VKVGAGFLMDIHYLSPAITHLRDITLWVDDHQMHVERFLCDLADCFNDGKAE
jgi:hypothetical protein